ncbi:MULTISPECIES: Mov34/MPN/PAD-1 family protein [Flavobacteriaceae]|jgi:integrative and conjugative element protein (TIGR02256 family)|uniref:Mov34/MPN/PAD-1 family protein n=1 Tax=Flavobacteriaceae TaxID=49546 RepID=UPI003A8FF037
MMYLGEEKTVIFDEGVINVFKFFRQTGKKSEMGGILLGKIVGNKIYVLKASIPTSFDKSSRFSFNRHKKSAQLFIDYEFLNSNGTIIYIGEWHTHPESNPTPSGPDLRMIKNQFKENIINEDFLLMVIIGLKSNFVAHYDGTKISELKLKSD